MPYWLLSYFERGTRAFLGSCIVRAPTVAEAILGLAAGGVSPGGDVVYTQLSGAFVPIPGTVGRLLSLDEIQRMGRPPPRLAN